jgi:hypothetical protein
MTSINNNNIKQEDNNHQIIIRHFKTHNNKINYKDSYDEATPYINFITKYIKKYGIKKIKIKTSPIERTLLTALVLYIKIKDIENISVSKPVIDENLVRDPLQKNKDSIIKYYKKNYKTKSRLVINITHSSTYPQVFTGLMQGMNIYNNITNIAKIHTHSLSYITDYNNKKKYGYNYKMELKHINL